MRQRAGIRAHHQPPAADGVVGCHGRPALAQSTVDRLLSNSYELVVEVPSFERWWFDFSLELTRFTTRIGAYVALLTDKYPSTVEHPAVALELDYPDVERDLNRGLPLVKWFLAIPHYILLFFLGIGVLVSVLLAWFVILFTGRYPRALFDYVVGRCSMGTSC